MKDNKVKNNTKYILRIATIGDFPEIEISQDEFERLEKSRKFLNAALAIEENYEMLIRSYIELEKNILETSLNRMIRLKADHDIFFDVRIQFNLRLLNFLSIARTYIDQVPRNINFIFSQKSKVKKIKSFFSEEYDKSFNYQFIESLRNYTQHRGLPTHLIKLPSKAVGESERLVSFSSHFFSKKEFFVNDRKFKSSVAKQLSDDDVNLIPPIRDYMESLSIVQKRVRGEISPSIDSARVIMEEKINRYKELESKTIGLTAFHLENSVWKRKVPIFLEWDDIRLRLIRENKELKNLRKRYVTNQI